MKNPLKLVVSLALPLLAGGLGTLFTTDAIQNWYPLLTKPSFSPPNWLFGPVWTLLYILMGVACYRIWAQAKVPTAKMTLYWVQLGFNAVWSPLFFGLHSPLLGMINIVIMLILIASTLISFFKTDKVAGYLLIPYLGWVSFATVLNGAILWLNF